MKVLVITSSYPDSEGRIAGTFVKQLNDHLSPLCSIIVLTPHYNGGLFHENLDGVTIIRYPFFFPFQYQKLSSNGGLAYNFINSPLGKIQLPLYLAFQILFGIYITHKHRPDIIHSQWLIPQGLTGSICSRIFPIPHISTVHSSEITFIRNYPIINLIIRFILENMSFLVSVSKHRLEELYAIYGTPLRNKNLQTQIIPNGANEIFFMSTQNPLNRKQSNATVTILFVGRLIPIKGIQYLLEAVPLILKKHPHLHLYIVGTGPMECELIDLTSKFGIERSVSFLGQMQPEQLVHYYQLADIVVFPSITDELGFTEGLPVVVLEAIITGRPIVASKIPGVCEIIEDGVNGLLVEEKSPEQIADAVVRLIEDEILYSQISENALKSAKKYTWERVSKQYLALYTSMIKNERDL